MPLLCRLREGSLAAPRPPAAGPPAAEPPPGSPSSFNARAAVPRRVRVLPGTRCRSGADCATAAAFPFLLSAPCEQDGDSGRCWRWCWCRCPRHAPTPEPPGRNAKATRVARCRLPVAAAAAAAASAATAGASLPELRLVACQELRLTCCLSLLPFLLPPRHPGHPLLPGCCCRTPGCCSFRLSRTTLVGAVLAAAAPVTVPR